MPVKYLHYGNLRKLSEDSIGATHTKLNGIVKAVPSLPRLFYKLRGFCRSMEKFATMGWNEEELNQRKRERERES